MLEWTEPTERHLFDLDYFLTNVRYRLTEWEVNFLESLKSRQLWTEKQLFTFINVSSKIYDRD